LTRLNSSICHETRLDTHTHSNGEEKLPAVFLFLPSWLVLYIQTGCAKRSRLHGLSLVRQRRRCLLVDETVANPTTAFLESGVAAIEGSTGRGNTHGTESFPLILFSFSRRHRRNVVHRTRFLLICDSTRLHTPAGSQTGRRPIWFHATECNARHCWNAVAGPHGAVNRSPPHLSVSVSST
jgi:hypothetical protein